VALRVTLEPGDEVVLSITNPQPGVRYAWDVSQTGGKLDTHLGTSVRFTAGTELGTKSLFVREMAHPERERLVVICVKDELPFVISPPHHVLAVGKEYRFEVRNDRHTSKEFHWIGDDAGGTLKPSSDTRSVYYTAGNVMGNFTLVVEDKRNPERFHATSKITICPEGQENRLKRREFVIGRNTYLLEVTTLNGGSPSYTQPQADDSHKISINSVHPIYAFSQRHRSAMTLHVMREVALQVALTELGANAGRVLQERVAAVLVQLLPKN